MKQRHQPIFTYPEWHWTLPHESLFDLTPDELFLYRLIIHSIS